MEEKKPWYHRFSFGAIKMKEEVEVKTIEFKDLKGFRKYWADKHPDIVKVAQSNNQFWGKQGEPVGDVYDRFFSTCADFMDEQVEKTKTPRRKKKNAK